MGHGMVGKIIYEIDSILNEHFHKVRQNLIQEFVAARRLVSRVGLRLSAPVV